jgi:predicted DNA-binding transcriptional regulator YafY
VRYSPRIARWVAEREGVAAAEDGRLTLEHPVADESWAVRHVLQYGPDAEVVEPAELRAAIVKRLETMTGTRG